MSSATYIYEVILSWIKRDWGYSHTNAIYANSKYAMNYAELCKQNAILKLDESYTSYTIQVVRMKLNEQTKQYENDNVILYEKVI